MKRGFTLIELLVVISIIGVLASTVLASLDSARVRARDTRRIQDLQQIHTAILLYFDDNEAYPCVGVVGNDTYIDDQTHCLATDLAPYLDTLPVDPRWGNNGTANWYYDYQFANYGQTYMLRTGLEGQTLPRNASYPNGTTCQDPQYPTCTWSRKDCVYASGDCSTLWYHLGQTF